MKISLMKNTSKTLVAELQLAMKDYSPRKYYGIKEQLACLGELIRTAEESLENVDRAEQKRQREFKQVSDKNVRFI